MNSGQYTDAGVRFKTALKKNPNHFKANYAFGVLYKRTEHYKEAVTYLSKAVRIEPKNEKASVDLAYVFIQEKQFRAATKILEPFSVNSKNPEVYFYMGDAYHQEKDYENAAKWLKLATKIIPPSNTNLLATTYGLLGDSLLALDRLNEAEKLLTNAAKLTKNPLIIAKLGATLFRIANHFHVEYLKDKNKLKDIENEIKNKKGKWARGKFKKTKAKEIKDLKETMSSKETQRNGLIEKTKKYLNNALKLKSKSSETIQAATKREILYYLGMSHLIMEEYPEARDVLIKFLRNNPKGPEAIDVRKKVSQLDEIIQRKEQEKLNKGKGE